MNEIDRARIEHMLDAAQEAVSFVQGETRLTFATDRKLVLALAMEVTIIGEAASRVSKDVQNAHPEIQWADIISTRNFLIHAYFKIDLDILWNIIAVDLLVLIPQLNTLLDTH